MMFGLRTKNKKTSLKQRFKEVLQHLLATLDCVSTQATLNFGNLVVILIADGAVSDFAGTA